MIEFDLRSDGDQCSIKPVFTKEANAECAQRLASVAYYVGIDGSFLKAQEKDFILTAYNMTRVPKGTKLNDVNKVAPKYAV